MNLAEEKNILQVFDDYLERKLPHLVLDLTIKRWNWSITAHHVFLRIFTCIFMFLLS